MASVTLANLRSRARVRADMVRSQAVSDTELTELVNSAYSEFYDLLVSTFEDYFLTSTTIPTVNGTDAYALPAAFYLLRGVEIVTGSGPNDFVPIDRFEFEERGSFSANDAVIGGGSVWPLTGSRFRYRLQGTANLVFNPVPDSVQTVRVWYVPSLTVLSADGDTVNGINGWEEYIVLRAAIHMLLKTQRDASLQLGLLEQLKQRILRMAKPRDVGQARVMGGRTRERFDPNNPWRR